MKRFFSAMALLLLGLILGACDGTSVEAHLDNAKAYMGHGDRTAAIIELKNAVQQDPANAEARWLLGSNYFDIGDFQSAEKELERALAGGVPESTIAPVQAQLLLALGEYDRLVALSDEGLDPANRSTVQAAKGLGILAQGNTAIAIDVIEGAMQNSPVSPYALVAGARLAMVEQSPARAKEQLDKAFALDSRYAPAWSMLGDIESREGNLEQAGTAYKKAIELGANTFSDRLKLAMLLIYQGEFKTAQQQLSRLKAQFADQPGVNFAQGLIYLQDQNMEEAKSAFEAASLYSGGNPFSLYYLAAIHWKEGNAFIARQNVTQFLAVVPDNALGLKLAATLDLKEKNFKEAETRLRTVVAQNPEDVIALNLLANALVAQGKREEGIQLLVKVAELQPESPEAQANLGAGYLAIGEHGLGLETLQSTLKLDPDFQPADILIVLNYLRQEDFDAAIKAATEYRDRNPANVNPYNLLGRVYLAAKQEKEAKAAFARALEVAPGDPAASNTLADLALRDKDYGAARDYYQQVLQHNPDYLQTLMKLSASYALEGKPEPMIEVLQRAIKAHPQALEPRLVLARYYLTSGQLEEVATALNGLSDEQKGLPDILAVTAGVEFARKGYNQALLILDQLISLRPTVGQYHYLKAAAYAGLGDSTKTESELKKAVELTPNHFYAQLALAQISLSRSEDELFERQLAGLKALAPEHPSVVQLEVAYARNKGDQEYALHLLESLFAQSPSTATMIALAQQSRMTGDSNSAIAMIQAWLVDHGDDTRARQTLAELYARAGQTDKATEQYLEVVKQEEDNLEALNNLAWYLRERDPVKALQFAERANKLSPDSASVLDTLAVVSMNNNNLAQAQRSIDRALDIAPDVPAVRLHKAQIQAAAGDKAGAVETLNSLLGSDAKFAERDEAQALLDKLR